MIKKNEITDVLFSYDVIILNNFKCASKIYEGLSTIMWNM